MAQCDPKTLMASASCFTCVPPGMWMPLKLVLLSRWLKILNPSADTSVQALMRNASCFTCLPPGLLGPLRLSLLCRIMAGSSQAPCANPAAPVITSFAIPSEDFFLITWGQATDPKLDFEIYFGKVSGGPYPCVLTVGASKRSQSSELSDCGGTLPFSPGNTIYVVMQARDSFTCESAFSNQFSATVH